MAFLIVEERGQRRHIPVRGISVSIGRAPDNDIVLSEEKSSRHHCIVEAAGSGYVLRDLGSLNGTWFGGLRVREQPLSFGEAFTIGEARIAIETEQATAFDTRADAMPPVIAAVASAPKQKASLTALPETHLLVRDRETVPEGRTDMSGGTGNLAGATVQKSAQAGLPVPPATLIAALNTFEAAAGRADPERLLTALTQFAAGVASGMRVCLALSDGNAALKPVAFANFITDYPLDEMPKDFTVVIANAAKSTKPFFLSSANAPACVYVPLTLPTGMWGALYLEKEVAGKDFDASERELIAALANAMGALAGFSGILRDNAKLKLESEGLRQQLDSIRLELQQRIDLQTAELSRMRELTPRAANEEFRYDYSSIIGRSAKMREVFKLLDRVTDLPVPVLIVGESGTGKDLIARIVHDHSPRASRGKFVAENCAALPESLLESELFGHARGAFTGADRDKIGLFEMADHGTIFLDEIGEMAPSLQAKLLRVLEDGMVRPVGGSKSKKVEFRLVAATNRSLEDMVKAGTFRQDLFYRINVITVRLPSLRERKEDIPALVDYFLKDVAAENKSAPKRASAGVLRAMMEYNWPGNVRELENEVKRMVALSEDDKISPDVLSPALRGHAAATGLANAQEDMPLKDLVERVERQRIEETLEKTGNNRSKAAELPGLSRLGLRKKMERYGIKAAGDEE